MSESYNRSVRDKIALDKIRRSLDTQQTFVFSLVDHEMKTIKKGLFDIQSKTTNLCDTISIITTKLINEKKEAEDDLKTMRADLKAGNAAAFDPEKEKKLLELIEHHKAKLTWIEPAKYGPQIKKTMDTMNLITSKKGFFGKLDKIRVANKVPTPEPRTPSPPRSMSSMDDVCTLIDHFSKLPKIYPSKPQKPTPKPSTIMMEVYAERKRQREVAMNYATRRRIRLTKNHCESLSNMYLTPTKRPQTVSEFSFRI